MMGSCPMRFQCVRDWLHVHPRRQALAPTDCTSQEFSQPPLTAGTIEISDPAEMGLASPPVYRPNEDIDMFPHLSLLRCDAISNARVECPESRQRVGQSYGRVLDLDCAVPPGKFTQSTRNVKSYPHGSPFRSTRLAFRQRFRLM